MSGAQAGLGRKAAGSTWALGALLAALTAPAVSFQPGAGIDASWQAALHLAAHEGMPFGREMVFTFGPLGFLSQPVAYFPVTGLLSAAYLMSLQLALCAGLVGVLRRTLPLPAVLVLTYVLANASRVLGAPELVVAVVVVAAVALLRGDHRGPVERLLVAVGGTVAGTHLLVKFSTGVAVLVIGALTAWFVGRRRWRSEATFLGSAAVALFVGWMATGNGLADLGRFLARSAELASAYSEAMGTENDHLAIDYPLAALVSAAMLVLAWQASRGWPRNRRVGLALVGAAWMYLTLKHQFVRHDVHHNFIFFAEALIVAAALLSRRGSAWVPSAAGVALLFAFLHSSSAPMLHLVNPIPTVRGAGGEIADLAAAGVERPGIAGAHQRLRDFYGLEPGTLALLSGRTVHIHPWEASVAWAFPEINWRPTPVFQAYSAYSSGLDRLNARFLSGPSAPDRILSEEARIDFRNPDWESPEAVVAMVCRYQELTTQHRWQVLARVPNRCGAEETLRVVEAHVGETVPVPEPAGPDMLVLARIRGLDRSPLFRLRAQLLKTPHINVALDGTRRYRLVPGTAGDGLIVRAPFAAVGYSEPFSISSYRSLKVEDGDWIGLGRVLTIEFVSVPILPAPSV